MDDPELVGEPPMGNGTLEPGDPMTRARLLWHTAAGRAEIQEESLAAPAPGEVLVEALYGGVSRGTERLVSEGRVPPAEHERMRAPHQRGAFPFPVAYGYALVGRVSEGPAELLGRTGFLLHPHASHALVAAESFVPLPDGVPPRRAVLAANMETALNAVWDARIGPGDRVAVVGAGVVGGLAALLASAVPGAEVLVVDIHPARASLAEALGCRFSAPDLAEGAHDVVIHASATEAGLATALALAGFEATVLELSWYGEGAVAAPLGGAFHSGRLRLVSSQVGAVPAERRARWSRRRRLEAALRLLADPRAEALLGEEVAFEDLAVEMPRLLAGGAGCPVVRYGP